MSEPLLLSEKLESAWAELCERWTVSHEWWGHEFQYVVSIKDCEELILRVEFWGGDIIVSIHAPVYYRAIRPFLLALDRVVQGGEAE